MIIVRKQNKSFQISISGGDKMDESKRLVMVFKNEADKQVSISIDDPRDDVTEAEIKAAMDLIVEKGIFKKGSYALTSVVEAQIVNTQTNEYDLVL